jgi:isoprenylcysteine carboxyl methyltransferase (ICMT) family protein YpbQ
MKNTSILQFLHFLASTVITEASQFWMTGQRYLSLCAAVVMRRTFCSILEEIWQIYLLNLKNYHIYM